MYRVLNLARLLGDVVATRRVHSNLRIRPPRAELCEASRIHYECAIDLIEAGGMMWQMMLRPRGCKDLCARVCRVRLRETLMGETQERIRKRVHV